MKGTTNIPEVAVIIRKGNNVLFIERCHTGYADGMFCLPGGHVEHAESFSAAAIREVYEEVGLRILPEDLRAVYTMQRASHRLEDVRVCVMFEATKWSGRAQNKEPERHGSLQWCDADSLPYDTIIEFQATCLQSLAKGKLYGELHMHDIIGQNS